MDLLCKDDSTSIPNMTIRHDSNAIEASKPLIQQQPSQAKLFTLDEMIRRRAAELGGATVYGAPETGYDDFKEHSAIDIDRYADAAVARLQAMGLKSVVCTFNCSENNKLTS